MRFETTMKVLPTFRIWTFQKRHATLSICQATCYKCQPTILAKRLRNKKQSVRCEILTDRLLCVSGKRDSNPRPSAWEANALPTEPLPPLYVCKVNVFSRRGKTVIRLFLFFIFGFRLFSLSLLLLIGLFEQLVHFRELFSHVEKQVDAIERSCPPSRI